MSHNIIFFQDLLQYHSIKVSMKVKTYQICTIYMYNINNVCKIQRNKAGINPAQHAERSKKEKVIMTLVPTPKLYVFLFNLRN